MKTAGIFVFLISIFLMGSSFQQSPSTKVSKYEDCFTVILQTKGVAAKADPDCIEIRWRNDCTVNMDLKYAFEQIGGGWVIGSTDGIAPHEEIGSFCSKGTGISKMWARPSSERATVVFPTNDEILGGIGK
ncbi:MAG: hypothetical protein ABIQ40_09505 [Bacteroidia bacterium]